MGKEKASIYVDPHDMKKIKIPVNSNSNFSLIMQRLEMQFTEINKTIEELRLCEIDVTITTESRER